MNAQLEDQVLCLHRWYDAFLSASIFSQWILGWIWIHLLEYCWNLLNYYYKNYWKKRLIKAQHNLQESIFVGLYRARIFLASLCLTSCFLFNFFRMVCFKEFLEAINRSDDDEDTCFIIVVIGLFKFWLLSELFPTCTFFSARCF